MTTAIGLFLYRRPAKTRKVLNGLRQNEMQGDLFLFSDGPEDHSQKEVAEVRNIIHGIDWCDPVIIERSENLGLSRSIMTGINRLFEDYDRVIVLEDDCVPSPNYLPFMRTCLDYYEDREQVMSITGFSLPIDILDTYPYDVYFTYRPNSWGWATWQQAWGKFERLDDYEAAIDRSDVNEIENRAGDELLVGLKKDIEDEIDSWAVWWTWSILQNDGVCINPVTTRIENIGHDGTGVHCSDDGGFDVEVPEEPLERDLSFPDHITVESTITDKFNSLMW